MRMRLCVIPSFMLAGLFCLTRLEGLPFAAPASVHAQADSSRSDQPPRPSSRPSNGATATVGELFQRHCAKCHGKDGTGGPTRNSMPDIPDFTAASWHAQRSDDQLLTSILEGKGDDMPAFARKIKEEQARALVAHIRAFDPTKGKSKKEKQKKPHSSSFDERFDRLQKEMNQLLRQSRELSQPLPQGQQAGVSK
jgi:mono/diheme cytochrome c family protein